MHEVTITQDFWLGRCEVTQEQWLAVMGSNPSRCGADSLHQPVDGVTWEEAMEFCRRLTEAEREAGRIDEGWEYTLPTEAQWEYACRAGTQTAYSFGDDPAALCYHGNYCDRSNTDLFDHQDLRNSDGFDRTAPVGCLHPNQWGFRDMHGNVWEWCRDWYGPYGKCPQTDPAGPETGSVRVDRGGAWNDSADMCRSARRLHDGRRQPCAAGLRVALCRVAGAGG
jgi:formylglycine-generating enzyme required for sulfatase activity